MISLIAGAILFFCSAYIGIEIRKYYRKRVRFFSLWLEFIDQLTTQISYLRTPLYEIIDSFLKDKKGEFCDVLLKYKGQISKIDDCDKSINSHCDKLGFLKAQEKELFNGFFKMLGKTDWNTQVLNLKNYRQNVLEIQQLTIKNLKQNGFLAYKLGILIGIAILIIVA